jgi:Fe-S-cluster containining protein
MRRSGLERLLRYCARPPFALERLEQVRDDQLVYRLPKPQADGSTQLRLTPLELIERLVALIPPPRIHRHRWGLGLDYFRLVIACPFLEEESCWIHVERPIACGEYLVTTPAQICTNPTAETVKCVNVPLEVSRTLRSFNGEWNDRADRWVPLILALKWAAEHPDDAKPLPGPEMTRELFSKLTGQEVPAT